MTSTIGFLHHQQLITTPTQLTNMGNMMMRLTWDVDRRLGVARMPSLHRRERTLANSPRRMPTHRTSVQSSRTEAGSRVLGGTRTSHLTPAPHPIHHTRGTTPERKIMKTWTRNPLSPDGTPNCTPALRPLADPKFVAYTARVGTEVCLRMQHTQG